MKNFIKFNLGITALILCLFSCENSTPVDTARESFCSMYIEEFVDRPVEVDKGQQHLKIDVSAYADWQLQTDVTWCQFSQASGQASDTLHPAVVDLTISANETGAVRTGRIRLLSSAVDTLLTVVQSQFSAINKDSWESATDAIYNMRVGWNLGNTLDVHGAWLDGKSAEEFERGWGNAYTTQDIIDKFKEAGFNAIRVPVTWYQHMSADNQVDEAWMNRVQEVVDYVMNTGMYCIINVHHDTGAADGVWLKANLDTHAQVQAKYKALWTQIAERFKNYDHHLLFESYNEMLDGDNTWTEPTDPNGCAVVNQYAQDFVDVVRATGGNNSYRNVCVNTYGASHVVPVLSAFSLPNDPVKNHIIVQVHDYSPFNFALNDDSPDKIFTESAAREIANFMKDLDDYFCSKGIPVIIGEFSATDKDNMPERIKHAECVISEANKYGIVCFKWMGLLNRHTLLWDEPDYKDIIIDTANPIKLSN